MADDSLTADARVILDDPIFGRDVIYKPRSGAEKSLRASIQKRECRQDEHAKAEWAWLFVLAADVPAPELGDCFDEGPGIATWTHRKHEGEAEYRKGMGPWSVLRVVKDRAPALGGL